ncbi:DUF2188 domain-containing protein [Amycolatopsis sp. NPDC050768]|uniref:DUF2188 domain-containing protein n=1 Tax=Amycolatopsis sp. NPDC050768 TaxID=3154839 RepID=UPI0033F6BE04
MKGSVGSYYGAGQWKTKVEGNQQASHTHGTKAEAVAGLGDGARAQRGAVRPRHGGQGSRSATPIRAAPIPARSQLTPLPALPSRGGSAVGQRHAGLVQVGEQVELQRLPGDCVS